MHEARSAYEDYPGYRVELLPQTVRVRVWQGETLLADSGRTLLVKETAHRDDFPEADVRLDLFDPSDHRSFCPFEGAAEYLSLVRAEHFTGHLSIATAMRPHAGIGEAMAHRTLSTGVLALTVSFHEPVRADEWMLYAHEPARRPGPPPCARAGVRRERPPAGVLLAGGHAARARRAGGTHGAGEGALSRGGGNDRIAV